MSVNFDDELKKSDRDTTIHEYIRPDWATFLASLLIKRLY